jgi:hypothetical protein
LLPISTPWEYFCALHLKGIVIILQVSNANWRKQERSKWRDQQSIAMYINLGRSRILQVSITIIDEVFKPIEHQRSSVDVLVWPGKRI